MTDSDFDETWCVDLLLGIFFPKIVDFFYQHGPNYGSENFVRNASDPFWSNTHISACMGPRDLIFIAN